MSKQELFQLKAGLGMLECSNLDATLVEEQSKQINIVLRFFGLSSEDKKI